MATPRCHNKLQIKLIAMCWLNPGQIHQMIPNLMWLVSEESWLLVPGTGGSRIVAPILCCWDIISCQGGGNRKCFLLLYIFKLLVRQYSMEHNDTLNSDVAALSTSWDSQTNIQICFSILACGPHTYQSSWTEHPEYGCHKRSQNWNESYHKNWALWCLKKAYVDPWMFLGQH